MGYENKLRRVVERHTLTTDRSTTQLDFDQVDFFSDTNLFGEATMSDTFDLNAFLGVPAIDPGWDPQSGL